MPAVTAEHQALAFRPYVAPVLRMAPGAVERFETSSAPVERLLAAGDDWLRQSDAGANNALSGPVEDVAPGDAVRVEILSIETDDWGWNAFVPRLGTLGQAAAPPFLLRLPIRDGRIWLTAERSVPLRPMIGCLGLA